jgi:YwiC-like protein
VSLKSVALPPEHGGWGFVLEPLVLGMAVAPSAAGAALVLVGLGAFLARHPLRVLMDDARRGHWSPRAPGAGAFALLYGTTAICGFYLARAWAASGLFWLPLLLAAPLALAQLLYDSRNRGRKLLPELLGATAPGCLVASIVLAAGGSLVSGLLLWALLGARAAASVLYVRARLRPAPAAARTTVLLGHVLAVLAAAWLAAAGLAPWLAVLAFGVLLGRAAFGLQARTVAARVVGVQELGYGLLTVFLLAVGWAYGL